MATVVHDAWQRLTRHGRIGPERTGPAGTAAIARTRAWRRELPRLVMLTPAAVLLSVFFLVPTIWAIWMSLTDRSLIGVGATQPRYIGLDNYRWLWDDPDFPKIIRNTAVFIIGAAVIGQTGLGLALALLLDHAKTHHARLAPVAYAAVLVAWISPPAFAGAIWGSIFEYRSGVFNKLLGTIGLGPVDMLFDHPMLSVIIAEAWRGTAFATVIFLGALQTIPAPIYEAARVDGANAWQRFWDHTLPLVSHLGAIVLMTTTIVAMGSFILIMTLTNGEPGYQSETIALYAYHYAFSTYQIGLGAAIAVVMLMLNLVFSAIYLRIARVTE